LGFGHAGLVHEAEHAQAVIHADDDHVAEFGDTCTRVPIERAGTGDERAAVIPDQYRTALAVGLGRPDRQRQAVFVLRPREIAHRGGKARAVLRRNRPVLRGVAFARPGLGRFGAAEAQLADGRGGVGDVAESDDAALGCAFQNAKLGLRHQ